jgi:hypothetical protein
MPPSTGTLDAAPVRASFEARAGQCYRAFVATEPAVPVSVEVRSSRGTSLVRQELSGAGAVPAAGPLCPSGDDDVTLDLSSQAGGRFWLELWAGRARADESEALSAAPLSTASAVSAPR